MSFRIEDKLFIKNVLSNDIIIEKEIVKKAKNLSKARAMAANPTVIRNWFVEYQKVLDKL